MADQLDQIKTEDDEVSLGDVSTPSIGLNRDSSADDYIFAPFSCLFKTTLLNCKICHCYVKDEQTLDEHTRLEHNLLYHCLSASCKSLSFNNWNALYNHMKNHTDHMSDVSFKCTDCLYVASTMVEIENHIGLYHQAGVFTCTHESCALPFWYRSALILHYNGKHPDCTDEQLNAIREMENVVAKHADVKPETEQLADVDPSGDGDANAVPGPVPVDTTNNESAQNENISIESSGNVEKTFKDSYTSTDSTITGTVVSSSTQTENISNDTSANIETPSQNSSSSSNTISGTVTTNSTIEQQQPSDTDSTLNIPLNNSQEMFDDPNTSNMLSNASTSASTSEELGRQTRNLPNPDNSTELQQQCTVDSELNISIDSSSNIEKPTRDSSICTNTITGTVATINSELQPSDIDSALNIIIDSISSNIEVTTNDSSADNISGTVTATGTIEQQQIVIDNDFPDNDSQEITDENLLNMSSIESISASTSGGPHITTRRRRKTVKSHSIRKQSSKRVKRLPSCHGIRSFRSNNSRYVSEKIYNNGLARKLNSTTLFSISIASSANAKKPTSGGPRKSNRIVPTVPPDNLNPIRKQPNSRNSKRSQSDQGRQSSKSKRRRVVQEVDEEEEDEAHDDEHEPNLNMRPIRSANIMIHFVECNEKDCNGNDCNWAFPTYNQLRNHMKEKHGLDPFKCYARGCTKSFKTESEFGGHSASHKNTKYLCPECADEFASQTNLTTHYQRVHQKGFYQCASVSGCTFKASLRCLIEAHHRTAHPPDNLECNLDGCNGKRFSDSGSLRRHKRTHTGIKQYECKVCTKMFFRRDTAIRHIKRKHRSNGRNTKTRGQFVRKLSKNECMLRA